MTLYPARAKAATSNFSNLKRENCTQPPGYSTLLHMTAAELAAYDLPAKPKGMSDSLYDQILRHAQQRICSTKTSNKISAGPIDEGLGGYSGNIAYGSYGVPTFNYVYSDWYVSCIAQNWWSQGESAATWVGLGGDSQHIASSRYALLQAGTVAGITDWHGSTTYYPFYEYVSGSNGSTAGNIQLPNISLSCGDHVFGEVYVDSSGIPGVTFEDWTKNQYSGEYFSTNPLQDMPDRVTAEWIVENPCTDSNCLTRHDLANFGKITFHGACSVQVNWTSQCVGNTQHNYTVDVNGYSGHELSWPGPIYSDGENGASPDAFDVHWVNYN